LKDEPLILMIFSDFHEHKNQCYQKYQRNQRFGFPTSLNPENYASDDHIFLLNFS